MSRITLNPSGGLAHFLLPLLVRPALLSLWFFDAVVGGRALCPPPITLAPNDSHQGKMEAFISEMFGLYFLLCLVSIRLLWLLVRNPPRFSVPSEMFQRRDRNLIS